MMTLNQHDGASALSTVVGPDVMCVVIVGTWLEFDASFRLARAGDL
jgi:hypothetical protein